MLWVSVIIHIEAQLDSGHLKTVLIVVPVFALTAAYSPFSSVLH